MTLIQSSPISGAPASSSGRYDVRLCQARKPSVLLLYPKTGMDYGSTVAPPHALLAVAAPVLRAGYSVRVLDQRKDVITRQTILDMVSSDLLCVGISAMTGTQIRNALALAGMVRDATGGNVPIVWGGPHPSVMPEQTCAHPLVDIVAVGEGDESFLEIVQAIDAKKGLGGIGGIVYKDGGKVISTPARSLMEIEELLPVPWELIDVEKYIYRDMYVRDKVRVLDIGQTSRGCPFNCGFCSSASIRERKWRDMSVDKSLDMIIENTKRFNLDGFWLRDDEFYIKRKRAHAIFEGMISAGLEGLGFYTSGTRADVLMKATEDELVMMKRAGAHTLKIGAESGSQRILDLMQKGIKLEQTLGANQRCKKHGIQPAFSLMIGYPTETFEDIDMTIDLAFRLKRENPMAQIETLAQYTAMPGTPDFALALKHGLRPPQSLDGWADWLFDDYDFEGLRCPWFSRKERIYLGNLSYMSIMSNALENVAGTAQNKAAAKVMETGAKVVGKFYRWRLRNKLYRVAPEMGIARWLRKKVFYGKTPDTEAVKTWTKYPRA